MRFPVRLSTHLSLALAARRLSRDTTPVVAHVDAATLEPRQARVLWIGGSEPLLNPQIAHTTRRLIASGRFVFLQTSGELLCRRVHEFLPVSGFLWVFSFTCGHNSVSLEALRRAKLSGFSACAHTEISADTKLSDLKSLREQLNRLSTDGWIISAERPAARSVCDRARLQQKVDEARQLIPSWRWRAFSALLEAALPHSAHERKHIQTEIAANRSMETPSQPDTSAFPESAGAQ